MIRIKFHIPCTTPTRRWWQVRQHTWTITEFLDYCDGAPVEITQHCAHCAKTVRYLDAPKRH